MSVFFVFEQQMADGPPRWSVIKQAVFLVIDRNGDMQLFLNSGPKAAKSASVPERVVSI
jgi:hypothetical protein